MEAGWINRCPLAVEVPFWIWYNIGRYYYTYCTNGYKWLYHRLRSSHATVDAGMRVCAYAGLDGTGGMERKLGRAWYL